MWIHGYLPTYSDMPLAEIDFSALSHVSHCFALPQANGSVVFAASEAQSKALIQAAHAAGAKVLLSVGGAKGAEGFGSALSSVVSRGLLVKNLMYFIRLGYDGIDVDMEPISLEATYLSFLQELRAALGTSAPVTTASSSTYTIKSGDTLTTIALALGTTVAGITNLNPGINAVNLQIGQVLKVPGVSTPAPVFIDLPYTTKEGDTLVSSGSGRPIKAGQTVIVKVPGFSTFPAPAASPLLLTAAFTPGNYALIAKAAPFLDQVNLMTYDLSGPYSGWETWHNSPLSNGGKVFKSTGKPLPCVDMIVSAALAAGIPTAKLGIGCDFWGKKWVGVTGPNQPLGAAEMGDISYRDVIYKYPPANSWDMASQVPFKSVVSPLQKQFVSYDDDRSCSAKVSWAKAQGLGGVILWDIGAGYLPSAPVGQRSPLLAAVKAAWKS